MSTAFPGPFCTSGTWKPVMAGVVDFGLRILNENLEEAAVLVLVANALGVFFELGGVVGLGKNIFEEDGVRYADGLQVLHRGAQRAAVDVAVARKADAADLYLRAFLDDERDSYSRRRNGPDLRPNRRKLPAMFCQQLLDCHFSLLDAGGIVLAFDRETDLALLEAVQDVAGGNRTQPGVVDLTDGLASLLR